MQSEFFIFRLKTSLNNYEFHLVLCDSPDDLARSTLFGFLFPLVCVGMARLVLRKPIEKFMQLFQDSIDEEQVGFIL